MMKRDVKQVRKNIAKRKREKSLSSSQMKVPWKFSPAAFPQDEEKHGYVPFATEDSNPNPDMKDTFITSLMMKSILAGILFFSVAIFVRMDIPLLEQPKQWTSHALTEEFPFATVNHWYQQQFGMPLAITPDQSPQITSEGLVLPVNGTVSQSFQANGQGIMINTTETSKVLSIDKGTVIFAGNLPETNKTVIVQHKDRSNTVYGNLTSINVHQYQFISSNEVIGEFDPAETDVKEVFFAIEKDNQYIDPVQVMQVDERP
ncbi:peptidoglycan DD-metalloendopeptidase family protein [Aquibacillus sediminis]|uniref:peptidoglycan DD-metalloendopeptidase family protein n=1 Tax=Aquibacillus sediminis TaxID=2574734 RepID=UPI001486A826|nr:peptidoglycan DD-metalloendopeptidase family protein [Aquibacillus sediminis]